MAPDGDCSILTNRGSIRVSSGPFGSEAYGVKTTSTDMARYLELNMDSSSLDAAMKGAIVATHTGYYKVDNTTQGLGWETYSYPTTLDVLLAGNSSDMALKPHKLERLVPPQEAGDDVLMISVRPLIMRAYLSR